MRALPILIMLFGSGCFAPDYHDGHLACALTPAPCPDGYHCAVDRRCWRDGRDPPRPPAHLTAAGGGGLHAADSRYDLTFMIGQPLAGRAVPPTVGEHTAQFGVLFDATSR
jgi:hypothetical protein